MVNGVEPEEPAPEAEKVDKPEGEGEGEPEAEAETEKKEEEEDYSYERRHRTPDLPPIKQQLTFIVYLSNRYVTEGSKVKLQAVVEGPNAAIRWKKDDESISYSSRVKNLSRDSLAILEFTNVVPEDAGTYTVIAQNEFNKITSSATLQVLQPSTNMDVEPVFTRSLKDTYHLVANELKLETGVHGHPPPQIEWYKDDVLLENNDRFEMLQHLDGTCELAISRPTADDSGKYVVKAENRVGRSEVCHLVLFEGVESHIAENMHYIGAFHADKSLLRPKPEDTEEEAEAAEPEIEPYEPPPMPPLPPSEPPKEGEAVAEGAPAEAEAPAEPPAEEEEVPPPVDYPVEIERPKKREKFNPIRFVTTVKDRYAAVGSTVKFQCILEGKQPIVRWYRGEDPISSSSRTKHKCVEGLCVLEISKLTLEDSGEYTCTARDDTGRVTSSGVLTVYELPPSEDVAPTFTRNIRETYQAKIDELRLDTHVRGPPVPTMYWEKDGLRIELNAKFEQIDHEDGTCELNIAHPCPADSAKYTCVATNKMGKSDISHKVVITQAAKRPSVISSERAERAEKIEVVEIPQPVEPEPVEPKPEGDTKDEQAEEPVEDDTPKLYSRREQPPPPDLKKFLYFKTFPVSRTVQEGDTVKWLVCIDGPEPVARWFHGDDPVPFSPNVKMTCIDGIACLTLSEVSKDDAGEYTLRVRGAENAIETSCHLNVYSPGEEEKKVPPTFTVGINDSYSLTENQLVLDCRVRGKPRPKIQWRKENAIIRPNEKYEQIDQSDGFCKLIIKNPTVNDSGFYTCVAQNVAAEYSITHEVNFEGGEVVATENLHGYFHRDPNKPRFVGPLGHQTVAVGGTAIITAEFMPSNTPIEVQWYRNNELLSPQEDINIFRDKGLYVLVIRNASISDEGTYTCSATNEFGKTETHATVDIANDASEDERPPLFQVRPDTDMKIQLGDPFSISFKIPIPTEPVELKPKLIFMKGSRDITKAERVTKEQDIADDMLRFTVHQSQIADCGTYFVVARNKFGTDRIYVSITVKTPKPKEEES